MNSGPTEAVLRAWRQIAVDGGDVDASERAFDAANEDGLTDRELLIAASRVALRFATESTGHTGGTLDQLLEIFLREYVENPDEA